MTKRETQNYGPGVSCLRMGARGDGDVSPASRRSRVSAPSSAALSWLQAVTAGSSSGPSPSGSHACAPTTNAANFHSFNFFLVSVSLEHVCREVPCLCVRAFTNSRHTHVHTHRYTRTHAGMALWVVKLANCHSCEAH